MLFSTRWLLFRFIRIKHSDNNFRHSDGKHILLSCGIVCSHSLDFPPCCRSGKNKGGGGKTHTVRTFDQNFSRLRRDFTTFLHYLLFRSIYHVFRTRNDCFSSCIHFFRACGALFLFQTFCACVESAIAARKFQNCSSSQRFMPHCKKRFVHGLLLPLVNQILSSLQNATRL